MLGQVIIAGSVGLCRWVYVCVLAQNKQAI